MQYMTEKVKNKTSYIIRHDRLECKELWMFMVESLGFAEDDNPVMAFITHISNNYPSVEIRREFYCDEQTHRYTSTAGFSLIFHRLAEAKKFLAELNGDD